jgi:hypothetical protein
LLHPANASQDFSTGERCDRPKCALVFEDKGMPDVVVTCINKIPRDNTHEGITHLGGAGWRWTRAQVIVSIKAGTNSFYTLVGGKRADVGVVNGPRGEYLRTYADNQWNDNLLALPECS